MREQLIQYVNLLFAGAPDSKEIRQEILHNTLDRYDDLIGQGKSPEAAYRLSITGIGDINEILSSTPQSASAVPGAASTPAENVRDDKNRRKNTAVAVAFFILCPFPLIILSEFGNGVIGLLLMFMMIAAGTALLILNGKEKSSPVEASAATSPKQELRKSVDGVIWAIGMALYFVVSFLTQAWYITWIIFPIIGSVQGLIRAIIDLKEAKDYEN